MGYFNIAGAGCPHCPWQLGQYPDGTMATVPVPAANTEDAQARAQSLVDRHIAHHHPETLPAA